MSEARCERCRILLREASSAISAHIGAVALLSEAVSVRESRASIDRLEAAVRATSLDHEVAVGRYEDHRRAHELSVMAA
jgi:hypothetical protein